MNSRSNRRTFFKNTAVAGLGLVILKDSRSARTYAANEKINFAIIGCGGRGGAFTNPQTAWDSDPVLKRGNVVAMCDVNATRGAVGFNRFPDVPKFEDYRVMIDKMAKEIDAVIVATSDHNHAAASAYAIRAGKHTFCEKGLTRTIHEARALAELAAEKKVITQKGNQAGYNVQVVEQIRAGAIGDVTEVHLIGEGGGGARPRPTETQEVPAGLNWDLWLGPTAFRPFHQQWMAWGQWRDFANGYMGMWGSHFYPAVFMALRVNELWPVGKTPPAAGAKTIKVTAEVSELCKDNYPRWALIRWELPARGAMPPATIFCHVGEGQGKAAETWQAMVKEKFGAIPEYADPADKKWNHWGADNPKAWIGTKGLMYSCGRGCGRSHVFLPAEKFASAPEAPQSLPRPLGAPGIAGFADAIQKGGTTPMCSFPEFGGPFTEWFLLANLATLFPEQTLEYDPVARKVVNLDEANAVVAPEYRKGWTL